MINLSKLAAPVIFLNYSGNVVSYKMYFLYLLWLFARITLFLKKG